MGQTRFAFRDAEATARFTSRQAPDSSVSKSPSPQPVTRLFVRREYFKLVGKPTLLKGYVYERQPLGDGQSVTSGDRVEVVITIETKNNYEYLLFEDVKPAGLEAVQIRSGESLFTKELKSGAVDRKFGDGSSSTTGLRADASTQNDRSGGSVRTPVSPGMDSSDYTGRTRWVYQELRDRKVAMFIDKLPEGVWEIRYDLRAEAPGTFHALPLIGQAMYVPEIRANGTEVRLTVEDKE